MIDIVKADLNDAHHSSAFIEVFNTYVSDPLGGNQPLCAFARTNLIEELRRRHTIHIFLAFDGMRAVGLANCIEGFSTFACKPLLNIHDLTVVPSHRGLGIAKWLIEAVELHARDMGCCKITLEVLEGNTVARSLYAACGFVDYALNPAIGHALFMHRLL